MFTKEKKKAQIRRTLDALKEAPATSLMLAKRTGILRSNLTRYLKKLEDQNKIVAIKEAPCELSGCKAKYYSAKPEHLPKECTPDLFPTKPWGV